MPACWLVSQFEMQGGAGHTDFKPRCNLLLRWVAGNVRGMVVFPSRPQIGVTTNVTTHPRGQFRLVLIKPSHYDDGYVIQ
jgi:hypothetical protein